MVGFYACARAGLVFGFWQDMRRNRICLGIGRTAKAVAAGFAVGLVLVLGAFAVSPSLHQCLHADCNHPDHLCAVSAFATGQLGWVETALVVIATACVFFVRGEFPGETPLASYLDFYFSPNRAPPQP